MNKKQFTESAIYRSVNRYIRIFFRNRYLFISVFLVVFLIFQLLLWPNPERFSQLRTSTLVKLLRGSGSKNFDKQFVKFVSGDPIYFVKNRKLFHVMSSKPCGPFKSLDGGFRVFTLKDKFRKIFDVDVSKESFNCAVDYPEEFQGNNFASHRIPMKLNITESEPRRLNIVMTGVGKDFTGGPLSIMHLANEIMLKGLNVRWINIDGYGLSAEEFIEHTKKYQFLEKFSTVEVVYDAMNVNNKPIPCNPNDIFMATLYYTSPKIHFTIKAYPELNQRNFIYMIQDYEPIFFPHGQDYMEAIESYRFPHFAIYSTPFLHKWFQVSKSGQYKFMPENSVEPYYFVEEPAIKHYPKLNAKVLEAPGRVRKLITYVRSHADRNAYTLTVDALSAAICANVFDENWLFIGLGATRDYNISLGYQCNKKRDLIIKKNIPEPEYQKLIATGDVGFSLMISPHPSLPPLDLVAAGLITVTNSFQTKTPDMLRSVSKNFVVAEPFIEDLIYGLQKAVKLSANVKYRQEGMDNFKWERSWTGPRCFGDPLLDKIRTWMDSPTKLWDVKVQVDAG